MSQLGGTYCSDELVKFVTSDIELTRAGPSYTIDTVRQLRSQGWAEVNWLIGADMLNYLPKWHRVHELLDEVTFLILARPGVPLKWDQLPEGWPAILRKNLVSAPMIDFSATDIRRRVRDGLPIEDLVPPPVSQYILDHGLYRR